MAHKVLKAITVKGNKMPAYGVKFIAWKKVYRDERYIDEFGSHSKRQAYILKLEVPAQARRVQPHYHHNKKDLYEKCRVSRAKVLAAYKVTYGPSSYRNEVDEKEVNPNRRHTFYSGYNHNFKYRLGEKITPDSFDNKASNHCGHGIHVYLNKRNAANH